LPITNAEPPRPKPTTVALKDITIVESVQPRGRMTFDAVKRYARLYRFSGPASLPPITLGRLPKRRRLVLLDGFHRVEAARQANLTHLPAYVYETTSAEAMWIAASENLKHGLPLGGAARRTVFQRFVSAGRNRKADGTLMSSRELSSALGLGSHASMLSWMKAYFPKIAAEMTGRDPDDVAAEPGEDKAAREDQLLHTVQWAEKELLRSIAKALKGVDRDRVIFEVGDIGKKVEAALNIPQGTLEETLTALEERDLSGDF
jgi:hypothetical protein